jgi:hypothetical protein
MKILGILALISCVWGLETQAGDHIKALDKMMYTINPNASIAGPIFKDQDSKEDKNKYLSNVIKIILKEADKKANKYKEAGDFQAYYTFLTMALTVPLHEGLYLQFRKVNENVCKLSINSGELIKKSNEQTFKIFSDYLKDGNDPFIPDCEKLASETKVTQLIRGGDGSDLSMMQISMRWNADDFLANKKYSNVEKSIEYGLGILLSGFDTVYRNFDQYPCLFENKGAFNRKKIIFSNVIRGVWGGKYNSGSVSKTCRFADPNSPYAKHDIGFLANLNKILSFNETIDVDIVGKFTLEKEENLAVTEVLKNFQKNTNSNKYLDKLISGK